MDSSLTAQMATIITAQVPPANKIRQFAQLGLTPRLNGRPLTTDQAITHASGQHAPTRHLTFPTPTGTYTVTFTRKSHTQDEGYQQSWCTFHDAFAFFPKDRTTATSASPEQMSITYHNACGQTLYLSADLDTDPVEHATTRPQALDLISLRRSGWRWTGTRFARNRVAYAEVTTTHGIDRYAR